MADTVLIPMQDVLGLGTEARMNQPATMGGNWRWRYRPGALKAELAQRLRELAELYERSNTDDIGRTYEDLQLQSSRGTG